MEEKPKNDRSKNGRTKKEKDKLKIIALGGLNEIGKNITVFEYGNDIIVVDCGLGFPDDDMYGIDIVIPDFSYLIANRNRVKGIVLTHGHEDHIGAMPYLLREMKATVYATPLTAGLLEGKLNEHSVADNANLIVKEAGDSFQLGCFTVEMIHVNHSIPDTVALAIKTPVGTVIVTSDFKIDTTPVSGGMIDIVRFGEFGKKGVLALLADSTNIEKKGYSPSEGTVGERLDELFHACTQRIIVTTFASNVHRLQQVLNCAAKYGRRVAVTGRSMENSLRVSTELGCVKIPDGLVMEVNQVKSLPPEKTVIITTGSQGEPMSALYRMAFSGHRQIEIQRGDRVIISASAVPGNEKTVNRVIDELFRRGAEVKYDKASELHVSGHAYQEELRMMLALIKPKFFIPVHGDHRHLYAHAKLAASVGVDQNNIVIADNGQVIELNGRKINKNGTVPSGKVFVDGTAVASVVVRDRQHLAQNGMIVVIANISSEDGSIVTGPDIVTRGFIYVKESEELMNELKEVVMQTLEPYTTSRVMDRSALRSSIKSDLSSYLYKKTRRNPMIMSVITEV